MATDNLFKAVNQEAGMSPELIFENIPLIEQMFNTDISTMVGDTVTFRNLETPNIDDLDVENFPGSCEGATQHCVGANSIKLNLFRGYNDQYKIEECELDKVEEIGIEAASSQLMRFKGRTDRAYALAKARLALRKDIVPKLTATTLSGTYANVWEEMNALLNILTKDNPYVSSQNYVGIITRSYYLKHQELKGACCDFLTGATPDPSYVPAHNLGSIIIVPNEWLTDGAGNYFDVAIYAKAFALFWFRCMKAEFFEYTNEFRGYAGYHTQGKWATSYDNHDTSFVGNMGVMANSTFVDDYVPATLTIDNSVSATVGALVDSAFLIANANLSTSNITSPIFEIFNANGNLVSQIDTSIAGSNTYSIRARSGQTTTGKYEFTVVVA